jgi:hypothetical protein
VKQSGGNVKIYSEVGHGTTVKIYLPRMHADVESLAVPEAEAYAPRSSAGQTILVVEDEENVRGSSLNAGFISGRPRYNYGKNCSSAPIGSWSDVAPASHAVSAAAR